MPEQQSSRGVPVTGAAFEAPFDTPVQRMGVGGLNLKESGDAQDPAMYLRMTNVVHDNSGQLEGRPGITLEEQGVSGSVHSMRRMNVPSGTPNKVRLIGADTSLYFGDSSYSAIASGFSGEPMTMALYRPPLSGEPWLFVGDYDKCVKVSFSGLVLPIGLTEPQSAAGAAAASTWETPILALDSSDGSDAAAWTGNAGYNYPSLDDETDPIPTDVPVTGDGGGVDGNTVEFKTNPGAAVIEAGRGYYSFWSLPKTLDLTVVGTETATDDDLIHMWLKFSHPDFTAEFRIYFVISDNFVTGVLPGTSFSGENSDFYVKAWRTNDFSQFIMANSSQIEAAETARINAIRDQDLKDRAIDDQRQTWEEQRAVIDPARVISLQTGAGRETWIEQGVLGVPLRRGDFQRVGATPNRNWGTITGIVIFIQTIDGVSGEVAVSLDDIYLTGGGHLDSTNPGSLQYDWRYTNYDPRTGAESNPSPEMTTGIDLLRQSAFVNPGSSYGDAAIRQRFYRRGGSLTADWYYCGENSADGGPFTDDFSDAELAAADTLELDNHPFLSSVNEDGDEVPEQPAPVIFGPVEDLLFALGDPYRAGDVYFSKPGKPDSWPASNHVEVCSPSEELMNGVVYGGQPYVFSRERMHVLYPSLRTGGVVSSAPTACKRGLISRWGVTVGLGSIWFVAQDGLYHTAGGPEELVSDQIRPLFFGKTIESYKPIDLAQAAYIRLEIHKQDLWFHYKDTDGQFQVLIYSIVYQYWRHYKYGVNVRMSYNDEGDENATLYLGATNGNLYAQGGLTDAGTAINGDVKLVHWAYGKPREDKLFGDIILDCDRNGQTITITPYLNHGTVTNPDQIVTSGTGRERYLLDPFGPNPQKARTLSLRFTWAATAPPTLYQVGASIIPQPDVTNLRVTQWEDLGQPDEVYLTGLTIDVDTNNVERSFEVQYDLGGTRNTLGPFTVLSDNRHKFKFSWPAVKANLVRINPIGDCTLWMLYRADWIFQPEPPRIAGWDINHENGWDQYVTGVDLECNTFGLTKTVEVYVDQVLVQTYNVSASGRRVVHLTIQPPLRGHILRFVATDDNPGLLYGHRWHADPEPSEQTNWNQNYTVAGAEADKWLKGVIFECDTFGQTKTVTVEIDGVVVETLAVTTNGRTVVQYSFEQHLGRVFRILPTDAFPSRLYMLQWIFDLEPLKLLRWETQEIDHGIRGWQVPLYAHITVKSTSDVTLTVHAYNQLGDPWTKAYTLPSTDGQKVKLFVPFEATKGVLFKYIVTSTQAFWLYREESRVTLVPWGTNQTTDVRPFGNDDLDVTRAMTNASLASARQGGGT